MTDLRAERAEAERDALRAQVEARPAVDVEGIARAVAAAQSVPFVGPKQRKIAQAVVAYLAGEGR